MKTLIIAATIASAFALPAAALDLGNGFTLDNTVTLEYHVEADTTVADFETELTYSVSEQVSVYAYTYVDLKDVDFTGIDLGVDYTPAQVKNLVLNAEAQFDDSFEYQELVISAEYKF